MMKRWIILSALLLSATAALAVTATSGTLTVSRAGTPGGLERTDLYWTTEIHSGAVRATVAAFDGTPERVTFVPDDSTTSTTPATGYDVRLLDLSDRDVLSSAGIGLSDTAETDAITASETTITTGTLLPAIGPLTFEVDDAGTTPTRAGTLRIYYRR
jgi:hypothetical protein